jgi:hypothetical protein
MLAQQAPPAVLRSGMASADTPLGVSNSDWGNRPKTKGKQIDVGTRAVLLSFLMTNASDANNKTAQVRILLYRSGGPAQVVGTYDLTCGNQAVNVKPGTNTAVTTSKWVDTIAVNGTESWIEGATQIVGNLAENVAQLAIKVYGCAFIAIELVSISASTTLDAYIAPIAELP